MELIRPLKPMPPIPVLQHPGAFGVKRHQHIHTGIDLYAPYGCPVRAMEDGEIIKVDWFTGPSINMPWWNDTRAVYVEGETGVFCYGEIQEFPDIKAGRHLKQGEYFGYVLTVLRKFKGRPMSMLHLELYDHGYVDDWREWKIGEEKPEHLKDPTEYLKNIPRVSIIFKDPFLQSVSTYRKFL